MRKHTMFGDTVFARLAARGQRSMLVWVVCFFGLVFLSPPVSAQQTTNEFRQQLHVCALRDLDKAETLLKPLPAVSYVRGRIQQTLGRFDTAVAAYDRAIAIEPGHLPATRCQEAARKGLACKVAINPFPLARAWDTDPSKLVAFTQHWEQWLRNHIRVVHPDLNPENSIVYAWVLGRRYMATGDLDTALFLFNDELRIHADSPLSLLGRAHVWAAGTRQREAIADFAKIIDLLLKDAHRIMARLAPFRGRELTPAVQYELDMLYSPGSPYGAFPTLMDLYEARALAHQKRGQLMHALADYQRVLQIVPGHAIASFTRDRLVSRIRRELDWRADDIIRRTLENVDRGGNPFAGLARFYPSFAKSHSDMSKARHRLGLIRRYLERGLYQVAVTYLLHWADTEDRLRAARFNLHSLYSAMADYRNALKVLDSFFADNPNSTYFLRERAAVHVALGHYDLAIADLTAYIDEPYYEYEARHQRARAYAAIGTYDRAIEDLRAIEPVIFPTSATLNFDMARFHAMKADYAATIRWATKTIALAPKYARAYELRALAYFILATVEPPQQAFQDQWSGCTPPPD